MNPSSSMLVSVLGLVMVSSVVGCAADATEAPAPAPDAVGSGSGESGSGEETATDDVTSMKYYDCRGGGADHEDWLGRFEIGLSATKIAITDLSRDAAPPDTGKLDRDYNPTPTYAGAVRFVGFAKILDEATFSDLANLEIIVSKELKAKAASGKLWIRTSGGGGDTTQYHCKSKTAKMKVVTSKKARLACSMKLICESGNPPGETCLSDLFINQTTASDATLKLTYLDHFGVHVVERKVNLPASDLSRTTKKVDGDWAGNKLKLEHRGGVTYTGTFKLPDGRSSEVKCNDLAMFD
jgi:hypothetical protein